jgi:hypothetical protein
MYSLNLLHNWIRFRFIGLLFRAIKLFPYIQRIQIIIYLPYIWWICFFTPCSNSVRVTRSLALSVCFLDSCLSFCIFSFGHCVACSSSIYGFWLPLWYIVCSSSSCCQLWLIQYRSTLHWFTQGVFFGSVYQALIFCVVFDRPLFIFLSAFLPLYCCGRGRRSHDPMIIGFPITYAISAYDHWCLWIRSNLDQGNMYNIMWQCLSVTSNRSVVFSGYLIKLTATL